MKKKMNFVLAVIAIGVLLYTVQHKSVTSTYKAVYAGVSDIYDYMTLHGVVEENQRKNIFVNDYCTITTSLRVGDSVKAGQVLFQAEPSVGSVGINISQDYISSFFGGYTVQGDTVVADIGKKQVLSPIDGVVMSINSTSGQNASPGVAVMSVADLTDMRVLCQVSEENIGKIKENMKAEITVDAVSSKILSGRVGVIKPYAKKAASILGTKDSVAKVDVLIDLDGLQDNLNPGYTAVTKIVTGSHFNALTLPYEYISQDDKNQQFVYTLGAGGRPQVVYITTGYELENTVEIASGITREDLVLLPHEGILNAANIRVKVQNAN